MFGTGVIATRHGFTGHEEMDEESLVNMNGRIYDPKIARFLSADPNIDGVEDLQGYNRYSYVENNPLSLIDPSGFDWITTNEGNYGIGFLTISTNLNLNLPSIPGGISFVGPTSNPLSILGNTAVIINVGSSPFKSGLPNISIGNNSSTSVNNGRNLSSTNSTPSPSPAVVSSPTGSSQVPSSYVMGKAGNNNGELLPTLRSIFYSVRSGLNAFDNTIFLGLPSRLFPRVFEYDESDPGAQFGTGGALAAGMYTGRTELEFLEEVPALVENVGGRRFWNKMTDFKGTRVYQRDDLINPNLLDARGRTNLERMQKGLAPVGPDGKSLNLHHTVQSMDGPLAEITGTFHKLYNSVIHINPSTIASGINRTVFDKFRISYWKNRAKDFF
jgi:RHS repeat-associated protein